jgi:hypothetical protein
MRRDELTLPGRPCPSEVRDSISQRAFNTSQADRCLPAEIGREIGDLADGMRDETSLRDERPLQS